MHEVQNIAMRIHESAGDNANIYEGVVIDESFDGQIRVTVVATGLGKKEKKQVKSPELESFINKQPQHISSFKERVAKITEKDRSLKAVSDAREEEFDIPAYLRYQQD
jgi:cell division protein FtsZ